jgi:hypothetical protein
MKTTFQTYQGVIMCTASDRMSACNRAMNIAAVHGYDSLVAIDPDGRISDYTVQLRRDYLPKFQHLKQAA